LHYKGFFDFLKFIYFWFVFKDLYHHEEVSVFCVAEFSVRDSSTVQAGLRQERW